jgi:hypothetical protein
VAASRNPFAGTDRQILLCALCSSANSAFDKPGANADRPDTVKLPATTHPSSLAGQATKEPAPTWPASKPDEARQTHNECLQARTEPSAAKPMKYVLACLSTFASFVNNRTCALYRTDR